MMLSRAANLGVARGRQDMNRKIAKGGTLAAKLARLYVCASNGAPIHFAFCPDGSCATALAIVAALGCLSVNRLVSR